MTVSCEATNAGISCGEQRGRHTGIEEFRHCSKDVLVATDVVSKVLDFQVFVNFQDIGAVRSLAKVLPKKDFDLEIELPDGCLVPHVPQRLN